MRLYLKDTEEKQSSYSTQHRHRTAESAWQPAAQLTVWGLAKAQSTARLDTALPRLVAIAKKEEGKKKEKKEKKKTKKQPDTS